MKGSYSVTRIGTFDDCKLKYKYQYIDRIESDLETIENFRGIIVHEVLEEFYKLVKGGAVRPLEWVTAKYEELWNKNYTDRIKIVKKELTARDYYEKGRQALVDYYESNRPFDRTKTVSTEQPLSFKIKAGGAEYDFYGILDRLDWNDRDGVFEIHDYKTTSTLMTQEEADNDWQLGLYHIAVREKWPEAKRAKLVWHSLLFNKELVSFRTEDQLEGLKRQVGEKIKEIASRDDFPPEKSALCDWCDFQGICPLWRHPKGLEGLGANDYKKDPGVILVSKYAELEKQKGELQEKIHAIEAEQEKVKEAAIEFAEKRKIQIIDGPANRLKVETKDEWRAPTRDENPAAWQGLREFLKREGKYEEVSTVLSSMLNYRLRNKVWPADLIEKVRKFLTRQITKSVRLIKKY